MTRLNLKQLLCMVSLLSAEVYGVADNDGVTTLDTNHLQNMVGEKDEPIQNDALLTRYHQIQEDGIGMTTMPGTSRLLTLHYVTMSPQSRNDDFWLCRKLSDSRFFEPFIAISVDPLFDDSDFTHSTVSQERISDLIGMNERYAQDIVSLIDSGIPFARVLDLSRGDVTAIGSYTQCDGMPFLVYGVDEFKRILTTPIFYKNVLIPGAIGQLGIKLMELVERQELIFDDRQRILSVMSEVLEKCNVDGIESEGVVAQKVLDEWMCEDEQIKNVYTSGNLKELFSERWKKYEADAGVLLHLYEVMCGAQVDTGANSDELKKEREHFCDLIFAPLEKIGYKGIFAKHLNGELSDALINRQGEVKCDCFKEVKDYFTTAQ